MRRARAATRTEEAEPRTPLRPAHLKAVARGRECGGRKAQARTDSLVDGLAPGKKVHCVQGLRPVSKALFCCNGFPSTIVQWKGQLRDWHVNDR